MDDRGRERPAGLVLAVAAVVVAAVLVAIAGGRGGLGAASEEAGRLVVERGSEPLGRSGKPARLRPAERPAGTTWRSSQALPSVPPAVVDASSRDRLVVARADGRLQSFEVASGSLTSLTVHGADVPRQLAVAGDLLVVRSDADLTQTDLVLSRVPASVEGLRGDPLIDLFGGGDAVTTVSATAGGWSLGRVTPTPDGVRTQRGAAVVPDRPVDVGDAGVLTEVPGNALVTDVDGGADEAVQAVPGVPLAIRGDRVVTLLCEAACEVKVVQVGGAAAVAVPLPPDRLVERRAGPRAVVDPTARRVALTLVGGPDGDADRQPAVIDLEDGTVDLVPVVLPTGPAVDAAATAMAWSSDGRRLYVPFGERVVVWPADGGDASFLELGSAAPITDLAVG